MTGTPAEVSDALFEELRARFDEAQLVELASALAWENYRARFNRVFDVSSEDYADGAFCPLPTAEVPSRHGQALPSDRERERTEPPTSSHHGR